MLYRETLLKNQDEEEEDEMKQRKTPASVNLPRALTSGSALIIMFQKSFMWKNNWQQEETSGTPRTYLLHYCDHK